MSKFRVMIVNKNGKPIAVRAAQVNGRVIYLSLREEQGDWYCAKKNNVPNNAEWEAILENIDEINKCLKRAGGITLEGWYWSSTEYNNYYAWVFSMSNGYRVYYVKNGSKNVRPVLDLKL